MFQTIGCRQKNVSNSFVALHFSMLQNYAISRCWFFIQNNVLCFLGKMHTKCCRKSPVCFTVWSCEDLYVIMIVNCPNIRRILVNFAEIVDFLFSSAHTGHHISFRFRNLRSVNRNSYKIYRLIDQSILTFLVSSLFFF